MPKAPSAEAPPSLAEVAEVVATVLRTRPEELGENLPLARYGLDSMTMVELAGELEQRFGIALEVESLPEAPSLGDLVAAVRAGGRRSAPVPDPFELMLADAESRLPLAGSAGVSPAPQGRPRSQQERSLLLTGATGFMGAFLVARLLREPDLQLICLVRCADAVSGRARVLAALERYGLATGEADRILALPANLALPGLGLSPADRAIAASADAVCHLGAAVNWVAPYQALRATNVLATRELLELAGEGARPFHFLSSLAVAYSTTGPRRFSENDHALPNLRGIHLGYAQSKVVAEALVAQASGQGLPVAVYRAALVTGESRDGKSNPEDFLALFLAGCIELGAAPDLDWSLDACPVDFVVEVLARRLLGEPGPPVLHLLNESPRAFREAILWLNLYGYQLALLPYEVWLERLEAALEEDAAQPLQSLRGFFFTRVEDRYLPELYEETKRSRAEAIVSRQWLTDQSLDCPPLDTNLLEKLSDALVAAGRWPRPAVRETDHGRPPIHLGADLFARFFPNLVHAEEVERGARHSILTELTSWASRRNYGLFRWRLSLAGSAGVPPAPRLEERAGRPRSQQEGMREVLVKVKPSDQETLAVARRVAALADPALGEVYAPFAHLLGFAEAHHRELALLRQEDTRFRRHTPKTFGVVDDDETGAWLAVCEYLEDVELLDSADDPAGWTKDHLEAAIRGLAALQAIHWGREAELRAEPWIGHVLTSADMATMRPLWRQLEAFSRDRFAAWADPEIEIRRRHLIETIEEWWPELEQQPRTLIHNDFNPRNLCFRKTAEGLSLVAYDWELATLHAPQHDLAELLCFVLSEKTTAEELQDLIELHRRVLQEETRQPLDAATWRRGFELCLADLMVNRLPMYAIVDRFRRQAFLPRVIATWRHLDRLALAGR